eukprot:Gb_13702 [translate_table: standard]
MPYSNTTRREMSRRRRNEMTVEEIEHARQQAHDRYVRRRDQETLKEREERNRRRREAYHQRRSRLGRNHGQSCSMKEIMRDIDTVETFNEAQIQGVEPTPSHTCDGQEYPTPIIIRSPTNNRSDGNSVGPSKRTCESREMHEENMNNDVHDHSFREFVDSVSRDAISSHRHPRILLRSDPNNIAQTSTSVEEIPVQPVFNQSTDVNRNHHECHRNHVQSDVSNFCVCSDDIAMNAHRAFRSRIDNLYVVQMCHVCNECYVGIRVFQTLDGPKCARCKSERGAHRFSMWNNMDPKEQPDVLGTAGIEKSYLIKAIRIALESAAFPLQTPLLLLTPTGITAFNISSTTIHSALRIPIKDMKPLQGVQLAIFQEELRPIQYIMIDEMSFLGPWLVMNVDSRLREAFPHYSHLPFGGRSMILLGDLAQLSPVMDKPLYTTTNRGSDPAQLRFCQLLTNLRNIIPTIADWELLMTRTDTSMGPNEASRFNDAIYLFSTNALVHDHNRHCLKCLNVPIVRSIAKKINQSSVLTVEDEQLDLQVLIGIGARVMLTSNLWIDVGLVNGALGHIRNIIYNPSVQPPSPSTYVLVEFDNYIGNAWDPSRPRGLTLDRATVDIGNVERQGLTFTAISRVRDLNSLRITPPFSFEHYARMGDSPQVNIRKKEEQRLRSLSS